MKKIYVLAVIVLLMFTACKKGSDSPTAPSTSCYAWSTGGSKCNYRGCANSSNVWYETSTGQTYNCASTSDCSAAAQAVINACY